jgi:hypothetical protein
MASGVFERKVSRVSVKWVMSMVLMYDSTHLRCMSLLADERKAASYPPHPEEGDPGTVPGNPPAESPNCGRPSVPHNQPKGMWPRIFFRNYCNFPGSFNQTQHSLVPAKNI